MSYDEMIGKMKITVTLDSNAKMALIELNESKNAQIIISNGDQKVNKNLELISKLGKDYPEKDKPFIQLFSCGIDKSNSSENLIALLEPNTFQDFNDDTGIYDLKELSLKKQLLAFSEIYDLLAYFESKNYTLL